VFKESEIKLKFFSAKKVVELISSVLNDFGLSLLSTPWGKSKKRSNLCQGEIGMDFSTFAK